eukprot:3968221-Amphidinium_carterae.3
MLECPGCPFSRPVRGAEAMLSMQLALGSPEHPVTSVREALHDYLTRRDDVGPLEDWLCPRCLCRDGMAKKTCHIALWPRVLCMQLKWWNVMGEVLTHSVHCDSIIVTDDGTSYKLEAVVIHLGPTPDNGHYVAYVYKESCWVRCDDTVVQPVPMEHLKTRLGEKPYLLFYSKVPAATSTPARLPPLPPPLEPPSEGNELSDLAPAVKSPPAEVVKIEHSTVSMAVHEQPLQVRHLHPKQLDPVKHDTTPVKTERKRLRGKQPDFFKIEASQPTTLTVDATDPVKTERKRLHGKQPETFVIETSQPKTHNKAKQSAGTRQAPAAHGTGTLALGQRCKTWGNFSAADKGAMIEALRNSATVKAVVEDLRETVPHLTTTNKKDKNYIARQTLSMWRSQLEQLTVAKSRRPRTWQNFTVDEQQHIESALVKHATYTDTVAEIQALVPGFTTSDKAAK